MRSSRSLGWAWCRRNKTRSFWQSSTLITTLITTVLRRLNVWINDRFISSWRHQMICWIRWTTIFFTRIRAGPSCSVRCRFLKRIGTSVRLLISMGGPAMFSRSNGLLVRLFGDAFIRGNLLYACRRWYLTWAKGLRKKWRMSNLHPPGCSQQSSSIESLRRLDRSGSNDIFKVRRRSGAGTRSATPPMLSGLAISQMTFHNKRSAAAIWGGRCLPRPTQF